MKRTWLRNKFLKTRSSESQKAYNKQQNFCLSLVIKVKREHFIQVELKNVIDSRAFWNTGKSFLSVRLKNKAKLH